MNHLTTSYTDEQQRLVERVAATLAPSIQGSFVARIDARIKRCAVANPSDVLLQHVIDNVLQEIRR